MKNKFLLTLVAFKCRAFAGLAISSILKNTNPDSFHLVIIDNGSNDATTELFKTYENNPNITVIINPENIGFPAAVNQGIDYFFNHPEFDYFTTVHSDIACVSPNWNEKLSKVFSDNPPIQCLGGLTTNQDEVQPQFGNIYAKMREQKHTHGKLTNLLPEEVNNILNLCYYNNITERVNAIESWFSDQLFKGCDNSFLSFSRKLVETIGYFDESFFPGMGEDSDYENRMRKLGWEVWRTGNVYTHHWCSVTYFNTMDGREVHDKAIGRLATKLTYDQQCLKYSCINNKDGSCTHTEPITTKGVVCTNYALNPQYNKADSRFPVR